MRIREQVKLDHDADPDKSDILCPTCGSSAVQPDGVEVHSKSLDPDSGVRVLIVEGEAVVSPMSPTGLHRRKAGLSVKFQCDACCEAFFLGIHHNNGRTQIFTALAPRKEPE